MFENRDSSFRRAGKDTPKEVDMYIASSSYFVLAYVTGTRYPTGQRGSMQPDVQYSGI